MIEIADGKARLTLEQRAYVKENPHNNRSNSKEVQINLIEGVVHWTSHCPLCSSVAGLMFQAEIDRQQRLVIQQAARCFLEEEFKVEGSSLKDVHLLLLQPWFSHDHGYNGARGRRVYHSGYTSFLSHQCQDVGEWYHFWNLPISALAYGLAKGMGEHNSALSDSVADQLFGDTREPNYQRVAEAVLNIDEQPEFVHHRIRVWKDNRVANVSIDLSPPKMEGKTMLDVQKKMYQLIGRSK